MDWIVFSFYRYFLLPGVYTLARLLSLLSLKNKLFESIQFRLRNEFHHRPTFNPDRHSVGIHAASGEIEYAYPLIRKLKESHPDCNIVVTLSSMSVLKAVMNQPMVDAVGPAPIDLAWLVNRFLKKYNFKVFLFARTDVWPEISLQLKQQHIPSYLFSATFSESSANKGHWLNALTRCALNNLNKIMAVSASDKKNLEAIGVAVPIDVLGDTRYDQVFFKKINTKKDLPKSPNDKKIFVAGSTWPEDEAVLLPALAKSANTWRAVIAPHEVTEETLIRIELFFSKHKLKTARLSKIKNLADVWDILIVDQYGYLFHLYDWAHLAFVGGSFKSKVHSVMEPLSFFKPVCVGPFHTNNREAIEFEKITMGTYPSTWVQAIHSTTELEQLLHFHANIPATEHNALTSQLKELLRQHQNATDRTLTQISF